MESDSEYFRANVAAVIVDRHGKVLAFRRLHGDAAEWQLPQGGLAPGEDTQTAVLRELLEETAIPGNQLDLLDQTAEWLGYELPEGYRSRKTGRGQVQKWFLFRFLGQDAVIQPDQKEFSTWQWMTPEDLLTSSAAFRRPVYEQVLSRFAPVMKAPAERFGLSSNWLRTPP